MSRPFREISRLLLIQSVVSLVLIGTPAAAQGTDIQNGGLQKPAWKWSLDERLAARFDPEIMAAREAERQAKEAELRNGWAGPLSREKARATEPSLVQEIIYGSKTPELLLPIEVFDALLERGFPAGEEKDLQQSRVWIEERAAALGYGHDFWAQLEKAAASYLKLLHEADRQRPANQANGDKHKTGLCRARSQALKAAQAELGEESFLRLLYEAVAPNVAIARLLGSNPPNYQRYSGDLRFQERGCQ
jgi:hypothetical protein